MLCGATHVEKNLDIIYYLDRNFFLENLTLWKAYNIMSVDGFKLDNMVTDWKNCQPHRKNCVDHTALPM